jgi:adenosylhomocysteine nucleosidase
MICLVVAYRAEAEALISHFRLRRQQQQAFALYSAGDVVLVISGSGKIHAAAAAAYLFSRSGCRRDAVWLNIGIAGHAERPPGSAHLARKVIDVATGGVVQMAIPQGSPWSSEALYTHDRPHRAGPGEHGMFDMEASGFLAAARRFSQPQLIHCLKIISDNRATAIEIPRPEQLADWMLRQMPRLDAFVAALQQQ